MITKFELTNAKWRLLLTADGTDYRGRFAASFFRCQDFPRIVMGVRVWPPDGVECRYAVDGELMGTLGMACAALSEKERPAKDSPLLIAARLWGAVA